jgi:ATP/maltotriose-dependent transcriptional regulator MalT
MTSRLSLSERGQAAATLTNHSHTHRGDIHTLVLVVDNMHEITAPAVRALLATLIKHQPPHLRQARRA